MGNKQPAYLLDYNATVGGLLLFQQCSSQMLNVVHCLRPKAAQALGYYDWDPHDFIP
jgi:hypothetical protein